MLGVSTWRVRKILAANAFIARPQGTPPTYDPRFPDLYRTLYDQPHQPIELRDRDWLARYLKDAPP